MNKVRVSDSNSPIPHGQQQSKSRTKVSLERKGRIDLPFSWHISRKMMWRNGKKTNKQKKIPSCIKKVPKSTKMSLSPDTGNQRVMVNLGPGASAFLYHVSFLDFLSSSMAGSSWNIAGSTLTRFLAYMYLQLSIPPAIMTQEISSLKQWFDLNCSSIFRPSPLVQERFSNNNSVFYSLLMKLQVGQM